MIYTRRCSLNEPSTGSIYVCVCDSRYISNLDAECVVCLIHACFSPFHAALIYQKIIFYVLTHFMLAPEDASSCGIRDISM